MLNCLKNIDWKKTGIFAAGVAFGTAGIKALSSDDAKNVYTQGTALVLRAKDCVMKVVTTVQENAEDIYEAAKNVNEERAAKKEAAEFEAQDKKRKEAIANSPYPSVAYEMADKLKEFTTQDIRIAIPGHTQRGGSPCPYDRVISSRFGAKAAELIKAKDFGKLVVFKDNKVTAIPLSESAGKLKYVSPDDDTVLAAKTLGISFGD